MIRIGVPKELGKGETRVAITPSSLSALQKIGCEVTIETGAGVLSGYSDEEYRSKGAKVSSSRDEVFKSEIVAQVRTFGADPAGEVDLPRLKRDQIVIGFSDPLGNPKACEPFAKANSLLLSMEMIPRISRAQSMDALSSQANIGGYKAVLIAAEKLPRMFPMMMTAAGTVKPARVLVVGAGVAGLQAIATAKRLGASVQAYDVRPDVKEQVQSLGAKFVELEIEAEGAQDKGGYAKAMGEEFYKKQQELMSNVVAESDVVITTAAIPGKKSPVLVTAAQIERMSPGSVIVDMAAERGGNCEGTKADEEILVNGVLILGPTNLPATVPFHASQTYSKNISTLIAEFVKDGKIEMKWDDPIIQGTVITKDGQIINERVKEVLGGR